MYHVCIEQIEQQWVAHVLELPGCFSAASSRSQCLTDLPGVIDAYRVRRQTPHDAGQQAIEIMEIVQAWKATTDYEVNAFFASDRPPLSDEEVGHALDLLDQSRHELFNVIAGLSPADLHYDVEDGWSMHRILGHIGAAEWWYLDRLGLSFSRADVPTDPVLRLKTVRAHLRSVLPGLAGDDRVVEARLELWSPRKLVRRALWHEGNHIAHTARFRDAVGIVHRHTPNPT